MKVTAQYSKKYIDSDRFITYVLYTKTLTEESVTAMTETKRKEKIRINAFWGDIFSKHKSRRRITNVEVLKLCPLFQHLTVRELGKISGLIYERRYQAGEYLFEKDQPGTAMFTCGSYVPG